MLDKIYDFFGAIPKEKYDTLLKKHNLLKADYYELENKYNILKERPIDIQNDLDKSKNLISELETRDRKLRKGLGIDEYTQALIKGEEYLNKQNSKMKERTKKKSWEVD